MGLDGAEETSDIEEPSGYFKIRNGKRKSDKRVTDIDIVDEQELRSALAKLPQNHEKEVRALLTRYRAEYQRWRFQLSCGFGLLMYGFGSKKALLEDFASSALTDGPVMVVNGYLPAVNVKRVIFKAACLLWDEQNRSTGSKRVRAKKAARCPPVSSQNEEELFAFICTLKTQFLYVVVHNIDGSGLRDNDIQRSLATFAACPQVRLVASIDHVNAPLLWNKQMASKQFNWWWHHTPTYASYSVENVHAPLLLATDGPTKNARTAILVLQSLTPNAQNVFRTLADFQMSNPDDQGVSQHQLYTVCREKFLVSSELTLRAILGEFRDHKLLKSRRGSNGQDCLYIPLPQESLAKLLQELT